MSNPPPKAVFLAPVVNAKGVSLAEQIDAVVTYNTEALDRDQRDTAQRVAEHAKLHAEDVDALHAAVVALEARGIQRFTELVKSNDALRGRIAILESRWYERLARWVRGFFNAAK
jgi:hypothetical protein